MEDIILRDHRYYFEMLYYDENILKFKKLFKVLKVENFWLNFELFLLFHVVLSTRGLHSQHILKMILRPFLNKVHLVYNKQAQKPSSHL